MDDPSNAAREVGDRRGESETLAWLGNLSCWRGDDWAARDACEHALHLAQNIGASIRNRPSLTHLGRAWAGLGQLIEAADAYRRALAIHRKFNNPSDTRIPGRSGGHRPGARPDRRRNHLH